MSVSDRAAHVMSVMLAVVLATHAAGWTVAHGTSPACPLQHHTCTPSASLTCCTAQTPAPADTARVPQVAPPSPTSSPASLMDMLNLPPAPDTPLPDITSAHWLRCLDLGILHHTLVI